MIEMDLVINNSTGLHARPAAQFVQKATSFKSSVKITAKGKTVDAKSILGIMGMGSAKGTSMTLSVDGIDEAECLEALRGLVESNFGEG